MTDKQIEVSKKPELCAIMRSDQIVERFEEITGKGNAGGYISSVLIAVSQNQDLMNCSPNSIIGSALRAATLELSVDPSIGQAYLVPFGGKATLIVGYKGLYHMAIRTGKYRYLNLVPIYENDDLTEDRSTGVITLKYGKTAVIPERRDRHDQTPAGYLLYMELLTGFKKSVFMTCEECDDHGKKYSKTYNSASGLWKKDPHKMYQKTVVRQGITKWGYLDPHDLMNMNQVDENDEDDTNYMKGVEIKEVPMQSVNQNLAALGFGSDEPEQQPEPEQAAMSFDEAFNMVDSKNVKYGNMTAKDLEGHRYGIGERMKKELTPDQQNECLNKLEAIKILLAVPESDRLKATGQETLL